MRRPPHPGQRACFELFERKWTAPIVAALLDGPQRFSALAARIDGMADKVLSHRLAELEAAGLVSRRQYTEIPPRVEYALTETGLALEPVVAAMERWSRDHGVRAVAEAPR
jgi:DNA-binding HxlR family transcriptional regulator